MPASLFCHECQSEWQGDDFECPNCQSAFVEEIPPEGAVDDPRNFDPDDVELPLDAIFQNAQVPSGAFGQQAPPPAGGAGGNAFARWATPAAAGGAGANGPTFLLGGQGGAASFAFGGGFGAGGGGGQGGGPAGLNPLATALLQSFGIIPPRQGFPPRQSQAGEGEAEHPDQEEQQADEGGRGQGRQQVPIRNLAAFLGEAFGGATPHPADDPDNNPFAEGGHERAQQEEGVEQNAQGAPAGGPRNQAGGSFGPLLSSLLGQFGFNVGPEAFGMAGQAGDYVFGEANFQQIVNDLMEQAAGRAGPQPAPDNMIEKLPRVKISQELLDTESIKDCAICQDPFLLSETTIPLSCNHIYHQDCLIPWLKNSGTCPTCRFALVPQPGQPGYGEQQAGDAEGGSSEGNANAEGSTSTSSSAATASRPTLHSRHNTSTSTSGMLEIDGGSSLPGSWTFPTPDADEDCMDVDEDEDGAGPSGEARGGRRKVEVGGAGRAAAEAAERRARQEREIEAGGEVMDGPVIEDVD
ncbi:hypothetical protein JCM11641_007346 [Rhodosporidiobolus odoratus]